MRVRFDLGEGAELRSLEPEDAEALFAVIEGSRASSTDVEAVGIWVNGEYAGNMGMRVDPLSNQGEIGYWLAEPFEGRGLVTKGCRALIEHGLHQLGLHRIEIKAAPHNVRSRAVAERLGFTQEAQLREAGRAAGGYHDLVVYGLLEHEWPSEA